MSIRQKNAREITKLEDDQGSVKRGAKSGQEPSGKGHDHIHFVKS